MSCPVPESISVKSGWVITRVDVTENSPGEELYQGLGLYCEPIKTSIDEAYQSSSSQQCAAKIFVNNFEKKNM